MKNKRGFTLIELLAVIIILAIIALIATPIVMRIIENSKKGAAERSAENYVHAVQTEVAALRTEGTILEGTYGIKANGNLCLDKTTTCNEAGEIKIEMTGKKPSGGTVVISNGKVQATGTSITVEEYTVTINASGSATATKGNGSSNEVAELPHYYWYEWSDGSLADGVPSSASESVPEDRNFYLRFDSASGTTIDAAYVCLVRNESEYCLKGADDDAYIANQDVIREAYEEVADTSACYFSASGSGCAVDGLGANVYHSGYEYQDPYVEVHYRDSGCHIDGNDFGCSE